MRDSLVRIAAVALALLPVLAIGFYFHARDRHRTSPELIGVALGCGAVISLFAVGIEYAVAAAGAAEFANAYLGSVAKALVYAAAPEELAKLLVLVFIVNRHEDCRRPADLLLGSVGVGLGFAALENIFFVVGESDWIQIAAMRAASSIPGHAIDAVFMGFFAADAIRRGARGNPWLKGTAVAIACHTLYDTPLFFLKGLAGGAVRTDVMVAAIAAFVFFAVVLAGSCLWALALLYRAGSWEDGDSQLASQGPWRWAGAALLGGGGIAIAAGVYLLLQSKPVGAAFLLASIVPTIFGASMMRRSGLPSVA